MTRTRTNKMSRRPGSRVPRWAAVTGIALVVAVSQSGCAASEAGAAAVVDGRRISVQDVQQAAADFEAFTGQPIPQQQVLYFLVIGPYVVDAAAQAGVGVSPDDARVQLTQRIDNPSGSGVSALQAAESVSRLTQLSEDRAKPILDRVVSTLRSVDIELSPRYGQFDTEQITITPPVENWIEAPAASTP